MNDLARLAQDLGNAARKAPAAADRVVHGAAQRVEADVFTGSGQAVATYGQGSAHLGSVDTTGVFGEDLGSSALADVDVGEVADRMAEGLLDAGVRLVTRGGA